MSSVFGTNGLVRTGNVYTIKCLASDKYLVGAKHGTTLSNESPKGNKDYQWVVTESKKSRGSYMIQCKGTELYLAGGVDEQSEKGYLFRQNKETDYTGWLFSPQENRTIAILSISAEMYLDGSSRDARISTNYEEQYLKWQFIQVEGIKKRESVLDFNIQKLSKDQQQDQQLKMLTEAIRLLEDKLMQLEEDVEERTESFVYMYMAHQHQFKKFGHGIHENKKSIKNTKDEVREFKEDVEEDMRQMKQKLGVFEQRLNDLADEMRKEFKQIESEFEEAREFRNKIENSPEYVMKELDDQLKLLTNRRRNKARKEFCKNFIAKCFNFEFDLRLENSSLIDVHASNHTFKNNSTKLQKIIDFTSVFTWLPVIGEGISTGYRLLSEGNKKYFEMSAQTYYRNAMNFIYEFYTHKKLFVYIAISILKDIFTEQKYWPETNKILQQQQECCEKNDYKVNQNVIEDLSSDLLKKFQKLLFLGIANNAGEDDLETVCENIRIHLRDTEKEKVEKFTNSVKDQNSGLLSNMYDEANEKIKKVSKKVSKVSKKVQTGVNYVKKKIVNNTFVKFCRKSW